MLRKDRFYEKLEMEDYGNKGEKFEFVMAIIYPTTRYYPYNPASKSGDIVAMGTHYQIKGHRGYFDKVKDLDDLKNHIYNVCKADRYLLRVTEAKKYWWLDVSKDEIIELAKNGYIKFQSDKTRGHYARWSMTVREGIHLNMKMGIKLHKTDIF